MTTKRRTWHSPLIKKIEGDRHPSSWWCPGKTAELQKRNFLGLPGKAELSAPAFQAKTPCPKKCTGQRPRAAAPGGTLQAGNRHSTDLTVYCASQDTRNR